VKPLTGQRVLLISPQPWDHIGLSKHHYARELARQGNEVCFLDPPAADVKRGVVAEKVRDVPRLTVIRYSLPIPPAIRIHARPMFDLLFRRRIAAIRQIIGAIDVVWCFEFNLFSDLRVFGAKLKLFHPVDPLSSSSHVDVGRSADLILSVSEQILSSFGDVPVPRALINHGLSSEFADIASRADVSAKRQPGRPRVGYAGNLTRPPLNREVLKQMVSDLPDAEFHFWGPREIPAGVSVRFADETREFIRFLESRSNVVLHGSVPSERLANEMQNMDCFVLSYSRDATESDRSNSHKILEYLSTGKVVVSSRISSYAGQATLLRMAPGEEDSVLPAMLKDTVERLEVLNSPELQRMRIDFALDNTYEKQLDRIRERVAALPSDIVARSSR
jgi:glycosyltransferase involved in cell wall biosynthesis